MRIDVTKPGSPGDVLKHHGKKGMKWGIKKGPSSTGFSLMKSKNTIKNFKNSDRFDTLRAKGEKFILTLF